MGGCIKAYLERLAGFDSLLCFKTIIFYYADTVHSSYLSLLNKLFTNTLLMYLYQVISGSFDGENFKSYTIGNAFKSYFMTDNEALRELHARLSKYENIKRIFSVEEKEVSMCSQILECYEYSIDSHLLRTYCTKILIWDNK